MNISFSLIDWLHSLISPQRITILAVVSGCFNPRALLRAHSRQDWGWAERPWVQAWSLVRDGEGAGAQDGCSGPLWVWPSPWMTPPLHGHCGPPGPSLVGEAGLGWFLPPTLPLGCLAGVHPSSGTWPHLLHCSAPSWVSAPHLALGALLRNGRSLAPSGGATPESPGGWTTRATGQKESCWAIPPWGAPPITADHLGAFSEDHPALGGLRFLLVFPPMDPSLCFLALDPCLSLLDSELSSILASRRLSWIKCVFLVY